MFWIKLCDEHYHAMSDDEINRMYEFLKPQMDGKNEDCLYFLARFKPDNQFKIVTEFNNSTEEVFSFEFNGKYHTERNRWISPEYIISVDKVNWKI